MEYFTLLEFAREPFSNSPDPDFFYASHQHLECLQKLELTVRLRQGLAVVIGDVGTGKTTISRQLLRRLSGQNDSIRASFILDPSFADSREFLHTLCSSFGISPAPEESERQVKESIKNLLFTRAVEKGEIIVLVIDEGQKLTSASLEILRELLNYETNNAKLLQIIIFAQKEFAETMARHANFTDRIALLYRLRPLSFTDTRRMIRFRLQQARANNQGSTPNLFSFCSFFAIYWATRGYPRKIVMLCSKAMLSLIIQNSSRVTTSLVLACTKRLPATSGEKDSSGRKRILLVLLLASVLLLALLPPANLFPPDISPPQKPGNAPRPDETAPAKNQPEPALAPALEPATVPAPAQAPTQQPAPIPTPAPVPTQQPAAASPSPETATALATHTTPQAATPPAPPAEKKTAQNQVKEQSPAAHETSSEEDKIIPTPEGQPINGEGETQIFEPTPADWTQTFEDTEPAVNQAGESGKIVSGPMPKKTPRRPLLGAIRMPHDETLGLLVVKLYGKYSSSHLNAIIRANPGLNDIHSLSDGFLIRIPGTLPYRLQTRQPLFWLRLATFDDLAAAYAWLRKNAATANGAPLLVPHLDSDKKLRIAAVGQVRFTSSEQAAKALERLPASLKNGAAIQEGWPDGTLFLGRYLGETASQQ